MMTGIVQESSDGTKYKYCEQCYQNGRDTLIAIYPGTSRRAFNALRYCPDCAKARKSKSDVTARANWRHEKAAENRARRKEVEIQRERIAVLADSLEKEKQYNEYLRGVCKRNGIKV